MCMRTLSAEPRDFREASTRKLHALAIVLDHEPVGLDSHELAAHLAPAGEPAAELPPDRPAELALLPEQAVQPGGGYFEIVGRVERRGRGRVEHVAELAAPLPVGKTKKSGQRPLFQEFSTCQGPTQGSWRFSGQARRRQEGYLRVSRACRARMASTTASLPTRLSWRVLRERTSTMPSFTKALPTVTRTGMPRRSASLNFTPGRSSRSSSMASKPCVRHAS